MYANIQSIEAFLATYFADSERQYELDAWTITDIHVSPHHAGYRAAIRIVNPFTRAVKLVSLPPLSQASLSEFIALYTTRFEQQFGRRFQCFDPETLTAYAQYDSWQNFKSSWLIRDNTPHFHKCMPILFDHISDNEYHTRTELNLRRLEYQRLKITVFVQRTNQFYDFFIKNVTDSDCAAIRNTIESRMTIHSDALFLRQKAE